MKKIDLITGYLGSGKTTFLLQYGRYLLNKGNKVGIIVYDYGAANIDMLVLGQLRGTNCELEMVDASGDTKTTQRRLRTKLISMAMGEYDCIIIEPSGLFDVNWFLDTVRDEPLDNWYEIRSVIGVANANLENNISDVEAYFIASELVSAGIILFSHVDEVGDDSFEIVRDRFEGIRNNLSNNLDSKRASSPDKYVYKKWNEYTEKDYERIMGAGYTIFDYPKKYSEEVFSSVCIFNIETSLEELKDKLNSLINDESFGKICRIKGFVKGNEANYMINVTDKEYKIAESRNGQGIIIVIGYDLDEIKIRNSFD